MEGMERMQGLRGGQNVQNGMRAGLFVLGFSLIVLFIGGLANHTRAWITWLDLVFGIVSLIAAVAPTRPPQAISPVATSRASSLLRAAPYVLGLALLVLWIVGMGFHASSYMVWWNFAFGIAYVVLGLLFVAPAFGHDTTRSASPRPI